MKFGFVSDPTKNIYLHQREKVDSSVWGASVAELFESNTDAGIIFLPHTRTVSSALPTAF